MKSSNILLLIISVLAISVWSCKPKQVIVEEEVAVEVEEAIEEVLSEDKKCNYDLLQGKGTITKMNFSNPDNIVIIFDYVPAEKSTVNLPSKGHIFNVEGIGKYPTKSWCEKNGIEQGATFAVNKYVLADNSDGEVCEKVKFSFVEFEGSSWK